MDVCQPCRRAHFVFVEEYGGPQHKTFDWFNSITRVRVFFKLEINGKEMKHDFDWEAGSVRSLRSLHSLHSLVCSLDVRTLMA